MPEPRTLPVRRGRGRVVGHELRDQEFFTQLAYRKSGRSRFTQDSPILADVIVRFGLLRDKGERLDLLLTPDWSKDPVQVADELRDWLGEHAHDGGDLAFEDEPLGDHAIAYNQSVVAVRLTFDELVCNVLPMSWWWQHGLISLDGHTPVDVCTDPKLCDIARGQLLAGLEIEIEGEDAAGAQWDKSQWLIRQDLAWAARLFYSVMASNLGGKRHAPVDDAGEIAEFFFGLVKRIANRQEHCFEEHGKPAPDSAWVYSVNRNRPIEPALYDSVPTTKADAASQTFSVTGDGICWAVIDTGIDARHPAFRKIDGGVPREHPFGKDGDRNDTRIKATYDFSRIRFDLSKAQQRAVKAGRLLDWESLEQDLELRVAHTERDYRTPLQGHGTHVAGILAANWRPDPEAVDPLGPPTTRRTLGRPLLGLCPDIELYDLRVFGKAAGDEFAVMSALQFVRSLNQRHDKLEVHGVNLSLAMGHEVSNYACGRSPVCDECTRLVGNGVVVVAAAGNAGRSIYTTTQNQKEEGYRTVSIADPGNTEAVITVGATHRREPHTYGVSYFSSRGPTGDGRSKPDLVAPGEKILSTVPGDGVAREDGTSQAAPHVSGAAALLMSRHRELIGDPARIKQVLMDTATDLGRERHFQGAGLVDVMRAIQSF